MKTLPFQQFLASKVRTEDICAACGFDDGQPVHGGFIFDGGCYIEDNISVDPEFAARGRYYLLIERSDWVGDDLDYLAKILWAYHYVFETQDVVTLADSELDYFIQGFCAARGYTVDGDLFGVVFSGPGPFSPREAADMIDAAVALEKTSRATPPD